MNSKVIVAISTPPGVGGIAVVRASGEGVLDMVLPHLSVATLQPQHATYCRFDDIDDGVAVYFSHGYTGEPTIEFSCHGSLYVQQAILQAIISSGARMAEPGEFTLRAFQHGRLNLSQAEAVADLIEATTPVQHQLAVSQLKGGYASKLKQMRQQLVDLTSLIELELDFSQEDVEFADRGRLDAMLAELTEQVERLSGSFQVGNAFKQGVPVAIVGRPNGGKSSLLNALLGDDRAIVSPIPGTTRDTIEDTVVIEGITFRFIDTAGLRQSDDPLENLGFGRSRRAVRQANVILFVRDATVPFVMSDVANDIASVTEGCDMEGKHLFLVNNKCDLPHGELTQGLVVSALDGMGLDHLKQCLVQAVRSDAAPFEGVMLTNLRHYESMTRLLSALQHVRQGLDNALPTDLVAVDLRDALYHLGSITGDVTSDELLGNIFSRFCIGK